MTTTSHANAAPAPLGPASALVKRRDRLVWLAYLLLYFTPWLMAPPTAGQLLASAVAIAVFLAVFFDAVTAERRSVLPHVLAMTAIGFALCRVSLSWSVFNVFAACLAARLQGRRLAVGMVLGLSAAVMLFGAALHLPWPSWVSGAFFGLLAGFGVFVQTDLERKNRQLQAAQEEVRALAATAERERIARDLHDLLGHTLTLVAVKADLAARLVERDEAASARREMQEVAEAARGALGEVRAAVSGMKGAPLAVEVERARRMLAAANVAAEVRTDAAPAADPRREAVLSMALREAVTNVIRHAGATRCVIDVAGEAGGALALSVADDGRGGPLQEGSGLTGMRARLQAAGGGLEVRSDGAGTRLVARLPRAAA